ncbi:MFS transporter [Streptomyces sp. NBC_01500]|uniref:MFS transporter n=1 Tax=Streptomyces sp. NBC_01500 TaxID=2903886 RepID=UPI00224F4610|nr:MFS transporter [Streptomyces sp. NBC_01500]MCX4553012.1 MFS transporter [Streptomyces sp. NBC_01500]
MSGASLDPSAKAADRGGIPAGARRPLARLALATWVSTVGNCFTTVALALAVAGLPGSGAGTVAAATAPTVVGTLTSVLAGGGLADRWNPRSLMAGAELTCGAVQTVTFVLLAAGPGTGMLWALGALSFLRGLASGVTGPAARAILPRVVPPHALQRANAALRTGMSLSVIVGPALAGWCASAVGPAEAIAADAASFFLAAALLYRIPVRAAAPRHPPVQGFRRELREGLAEVVGRRWLLLVIVQAAVLNLVALGPMQVLAPLAAQEGYSGARGYAAFLTSAGVGAVLGGMLMLRWAPKHPVLMCSAVMAAFCLPCLAMAVHGSWWQVTLAYGLLGTAEGIFAILWSTALQRGVPAGVLGRVSAWDFLGSFASLPLGMVLAGPMTAALGLDDSLLAMGAVGCCVVAWPLLWPRARSALRAV